MFGLSGGKDHEVDAARTGSVLKRLELRRLHYLRVRQNRDTPLIGHNFHEDFKPFATAGT